MSARKRLWRVFYLNANGDERVIFVVATSEPTAKREALAHIAERKAKILSCSKAF